MANEIHVSLLRQGVQAWNQWRSEHRDLRPDLSAEDFSRLTNTQLKGADLSDTNLSGANLDYAYMKGTVLRRTRLDDARCHNTTLIEADLTDAKLLGANLARANLYRATCIETNFSGSDLGGASLVETQVEGACFDNCAVYGLSAWGLRGTPKSQLNLIVTPPGEPVVTADQLEVAQFIYTLLSNPKIRDVINTIGKKGVLILGGGQPGGKMRFSAVRMWSQAVSFFFRHLVLAPLTPILIVPFISDLFTAALVAQERRGDFLQPAVALRQALSTLPTFVRLKLYYYARAFAWGLIPIYGLIRDIDERLAWAMSSNVTLLENRTQFSDGAARCKDLVTEFRGECIRVLITVPVLLLLPLTVVLALGQSSWVFWAVLGAFVWLSLPGSAAANTYLYLWIREQEGDASIQAPSVASSPNS